jgi:hypothetical protein
MRWVWSRLWSSQKIEPGAVSFGTAPIANGTGKRRSQLITHGRLGLRPGLGHEPACEQVECGRELSRDLGNAVGEGDDLTVEDAAGGQVHKLG